MKSSYFLPLFFVLSTTTSALSFSLPLLARAEDSPSLPSTSPSTAAPSSNSTDIHSPAKADVNRPIRDKWALVVGISNFQNKNIPGLKYAAKDARDFRDYLVKEAGFAPDHVRLLLDEKANQRRVISELGTKYLARVAKADDLVVLYFSTHGSPAQADIRGKNFIVAYDSDPEDLFTSGIEMDKIIESIRSRILCDRVVLVLDACHSGAVENRAKGLVRSSNFDANELVAGCGQMVICSSSPEQRSWESKRYENGIFTRKLLEGLKMNGKRTKLGEAFRFVASAVPAEAQEDYAANQTPNIKSKWDGNELALALPATAPQNLPATIKQILEPDSTAEATRVIDRASTIVPRPANFANKSDLDVGLALYAKGDYGSAVSFLSSFAGGPGLKNSAAHYALGNALVKVNKVKEAVSAYRQSYKLDPQGKNSADCLRMINYYSGVARTGGQVGNQSGNQSGNQGGPNIIGSQTTMSNSGSYGLSKTQLVDPKALADLKNKLPRIPTAARRERPTQAEFLQWSDTEKANFAGEASVRVDKAKQNLNDAQELLKRVESMIYTLVPNSRSYGESEADFRARQEAARSQTYELLTCYRNNVAEKTSILQEESAILTQAEASAAPLGQRIFSNVHHGSTTSTGATAGCKK